MPITSLSDSINISINPLVQFSLVSYYDSITMAFILYIIINSPRYPLSVVILVSNTNAYICFNKQKYRRVKADPEITIYNATTVNNTAS